MRRIPGWFLILSTGGASAVRAARDSFPLRNAWLPTSTSATCPGPPPSDELSQMFAQYGQVRRPRSSPIARPAAAAASASSKWPTSRGPGRHRRTQRLPDERPPLTVNIARAPRRARRRGCGGGGGGGGRGGYGGGGGGRGGSAEVVVVRWLRRRRWWRLRRRWRRPLLEPMMNAKPMPDRIGKV